MTDDQKPETDTTADDRKNWATPAVRAVVSGKRTAGGLFGVNDQEDSFYSLS